MKLILNSFCDAASKFPRQFSISMGWVLLLTMLNAFVPWGLRRYLLQVTEQNDYQVLMAGIVFFAVYFVIKILVNIIWYVSLDQFGGKYIEALSLSLERAMAETSYDKIEHLQPGILRNIMYTDVLNVFCSVGHHIPAMIGALAVMVVSVVLALLCEAKMTVFICISVGVGLALSWSSRKILASTAGQTNARLKEHDRWCTQFVDMLPLIQQNPILGYYLSQTSDNLDNFVRTSIREDTRTVFWTGLVGGYNSLFSIVLSAMLAIPAAGNSVSNLVFFTMVANLILEQAQLAEQLFQQMVKAQVSFRNVDQVVHLPKMGGKTPVSGIEQMRFDRVSFSYTGHTQAVCGISCQLSKGDIVLLKGRNGSGKSTFLKLLTGAYPPSEGDIFLNDRPLSIYDRASLNQKILYINQDEKCLNETFRTYLEIITGESISDDRYKKLLHFVDLPEDERKISGNGTSLSVGQRKKLFAMKLFLRFEQTDLIILDELTAGLDVQATQQVYTKLFQMAKKQDKILVLVDHNLPETIPFTHTFHFQEGKLIEE